MYNGVIPIYVKPYTPLIVKKPPEKVSNDPENTPESQQPQDSKDNNNNTSTGQEQQTAINYNAKRVNISQILADFKETIKAINPPDELSEEASQYLNLVKLQSQKSKPSSTIIKTNLRNAASILDEYISDTLKKPSGVVSNWIDALLLQKIDYKIPVKAPVKTETQSLNVNPFAQVSTAANENVEDKKTETSQEQAKESIKQEQPINLDAVRLQKLYKNAVKSADSNDYDKALETYQQALKLAKTTGNKDTQTDIYMDMASIYDKNNDLPNALTNYNNAAKSAKKIGDKETQASAHYNMATIYDDVGKINAALDHYHAALALDGSTDNIKGQTLTLNSIGNMYTVKQDYKSALDYYKLAFGLAKEQNDNTGKTIILSNVAGVFRDLGYDDKALKYYRDSIKSASQSGNIEDCAKSYEQAGDIMLKNNKTQKAVNLYKKSMQAAQKIGDRSWTSRISEKITNIS